MSNLLIRTSAKRRPDYLPGRDVRTSTHHASTRNVVLECEGVNCPCGCGRRDTASDQDGQHARTQSKNRRVGGLD